MKTISNSDFTLLVDKIPLLLRYARHSVPRSDTRALNALRLLTSLHRKFNKQIPTKRPKTPTT